MKSAALSDTHRLVAESEALSLCSDSCSSSRVTIRRTPTKTGSVRFRDAAGVRARHLYGLSNSKRGTETPGRAALLLLGHGNTTRPLTTATRPRPKERLFLRQGGVMQVSQQPACAERSNHH